MHHQFRIKTTCQGFRHFTKRHLAKRIGQMQLTSVTQILSEAGFAEPKLRALIPDYNNYTTLLLQPQGDIEADATGVWNADRDLATRQYSAFLSDATDLNADLAVTPEYSMPWAVLEERISSGHVPSSGALWVIGCESITLAELRAVGERLSPHAKLIFEPLESVPDRFLDPVVYVFLAPRLDDVTRQQVLLLAQFKTCPMGDDGHFEINSLQPGTRIYYFGNGSRQLRLATIICSDAFAFSDTHATEIYDRTLLIHIQLNPKPRHEQYRQYRTKLLQLSGDQTEIVCLNWARDVHETYGTARKCWNNISGSAWYLRPDKFDLCDGTLAENHRKGLYYTWSQSLRCHAMFFNYLPATFLINASKVAHLAVPAALSRRRGPQVLEVRVWDVESSAWATVGSVDDGFSSIVEECGDAQGDLTHLVTHNPLAAERVLALSAGAITSSIDWHSVKNLDSCSINPSEVVFRVTACQDTDTEAIQFRTKRLRNCRRLATLLKTKLPTALADLMHGSRFAWDRAYPHANVTAMDGRHATVILLGDEFTASTAQDLADKAADYLGRWGADPDAIIEARQRLHVWYLDTSGQPVLCDQRGVINYDEAHPVSPFDYTRSK